MIDPPIDELMEKVDNSYTLCVVISKRAKEINNGARLLTECDSNKAVSIAAHEFNEERFTYIKPKLTANRHGSKV